MPVSLKWIPVRVKKARQNKNLKPGLDLIRTERIVAARRLAHTPKRTRNCDEQGPHVVFDILQVPSPAACLEQAAQTDVRRSSA